MPDSTPAGQFQINRLAIRQSDALRLERCRLIKGHGQTISDIGALLRRRLSSKSAARSTATAPTKQAIKNVAKIHAFGVEPARTLPEPAAALTKGIAAPAKGAAGLAVLVNLAPVKLAALVLV